MDVASIGYDEKARSENGGTESREIQENMSPCLSFPNRYDLRLLEVIRTIISQK